MDMELKTGAVRLNFERTEAWIDKNERAAATIGYLVESSQLQLIKNTSSARELWDILHDYHVKQTSAGRVVLLKRMSRLELEENGNVEEHLIAMDAMYDKLAEVGCDMADELKGAFILASLPESYEGLVKVMEGIDGG
ncbi:uncharacterized protein LOC134207192 [Armigeres subalbatus]|uniref:uncharacterized protein LOC134207192 n=1 Tax=Armigeres subalbatus TaxID=124917 RepID=UPI002ED0F80A